MLIVLGTDGSAGAEAALRLLLTLPVGGHEVVVASAVRGPGGEAHALRLVDAAARRLRAAGARTSTIVREGAPADVLYELIGELGADLVVVGSRGLGSLAGAIFGSTARALARLSAIPLLVVRGEHGRVRHALVAGENEADVRVALDVLRRLASRTTSDVRVAHASAAREVLTRADAASADLIVLGSRADPLGRGFLHEELTDQVLSEARCAVLVARDHAGSL